VNPAALRERCRAGVAALLRRSGPPPRPSRWAWAADTVLALALAAGTVQGALTLPGDDRTQVVSERRHAGLPGSLVPEAPPAPGPLVVHHVPPVHPWQLVVAVLVAMPLVARRCYPLAALGVVVVATLAYQGNGSMAAAFALTCCLIAAYSVVMYGVYRVLAVAGVVAGAGAGLLAAFSQHLSDPRSGYLTLLLLLPLGLVANAVHSWKQRVRVLEAERETATRLAVARDRARIAQELHDVVTHSVSVMVVQAGAARTVLDAAPDRAREALRSVEAGGRAALSELRHAMGLLTMAGDAAEPTADLAPDLAPQPGLDQLPALAGRVRDAGVPVELAVTGTPAPLPPGVDLAAYRVVQEALTNALKHAAGAAVRIDVEHRPGELRLEVSDSGGAALPAARLGGGRGLLGLRERLAVYGGSLHAGARPTGGYRVRAVIPVEQP
jgi:signal transduction histidine kinase